MEGLLGQKIENIVLLRFISVYVIPVAFQILDMILQLLEHFA